MNAILDFLRNETPLVSAAITAVTGLLTGPVFRMDATAVGSITAMVVVIFNFWVRFQVYSKKGAANVATAAATQAVASVTSEVVGAVGEVTAEGQMAVTDAVESVLGGASELIKPPG